MPSGNYRASIFFVKSTIFANVELSNQLDWATLRFEEVAFGNTVLAISDAGNSFQTQVLQPDYRYPLTTTWLVGIAGQFNADTGALGWTFRTLDPQTGLLPNDVEAGFLPPNDASGRGEGHVTFSVELRPNLAVGTLITNQASIVFDTNEAIVTNVYSNTIQALPSAIPTIYLPIILK